MSDGRDQGRDSCGATADEEFGDFGKRGGDSTAKDERFDSGIASLPEEFPREPTMSDALRERGLDGDTILHLAIIMKVPDAVPLALIQLADDIGILNLQNDLLQTPLHLAVVTERPVVVQKLVESGSAPWIQDMQGNTPLHLACDLTTRACLHAIMHSVPPTALATALRVQNYPKGLTCLHVAIMKQDLSMVEDLLQLGGDIDAWVCFEPLPPFKASQNVAIAFIHIQRPL
uniref:Uncharacterized protein n=1 Tax=Eptatretus burgeri TaxID=7764 RepID=A0A8C4RAY6_EPTBU